VGVLGGWREEGRELIESGLVGSERVGAEPG